VPSNEAMYASYRANALKQWVVDVEASEEAPALIFLRGHSPASGTRYGFILAGRGEIPSRVQVVRGLKGVVRVDDGFYTSVILCDPDRRDALIQEIRVRLAALGFLTTAEWEAEVARAAPSQDPRPTSFMQGRGRPLVK